MGYQITNPGFNIADDDPCADKLSFVDKKQAEAAKIQAKWEHGNKKLKVYLCDKCGLYHLTTDREEED